MVWPLIVCVKLKLKGENGRVDDGFENKKNECGLMGHKSADCWEKASNGSKRPSGWVSKKNKGGIYDGGVSGASIDIYVAAVSKLEDVCNLATLGIEMM